MNGRAGAVLSMELRNADGGVAEMSGNGIRCLVQAAVDARWVAPGPVSVATAGGVRTVHYRAGDRPGLGFASVDMGPATLGPELAPETLLAGSRSDAVALGIRFARTVGMGNPHIVLFGEEVDDATVATVGPRLERSVDATGQRGVRLAHGRFRLPHLAGVGARAWARPWPAVPAPARRRPPPTAGVWWAPW